MFGPREGAQLERVGPKGKNEERGASAKSQDKNGKVTLQRSEVTVQRKK